MRLMAGMLWLLLLVGCSKRDRPPAPAPAPAPEAAPTAAAATVPAPIPMAGPAAMATPAVEWVMDVMQVVGKSEAEVAELLGPPASCEDIHRARLCRYPPDENEVMFVAGKADMITVQGMDAVAFNDHALAALGIGPAIPELSNEHAIRWESLPGLEEVTVFPGSGDSVHYAYVKVGRH